MQKNWRQFGEGGKNRWRNQIEKDSEDEKQFNSNSITKFVKFLP